MDLRFPEAEATSAEVDALDALLGPAASEEGWGRETGGLHQAQSRRHHLLAALHALNDRVGWISPGGLGELCKRLDVPPAEAYGVASFYALFPMRPQPPRVVHVCTDLACQNVCKPMVEALTAEFGAPGDSEGAITWLNSPCLGLCDRGPAVLVTEAGSPAVHAAMAPASIPVVIRAAYQGPAALPAEPAPEMAVPQVGDPSLVLLKRVGKVDPLSLDDYRAHGGYDALRNAVAIGPGGVIREVLDAKLVGRGGAAFPAGRKWDAVAKQPVRTHYVIANADESEPGTFKDRVLMEADPFALVEAMTIAGYATGSEQGFIYLRGEYPRAMHNLASAIETARHRGLLGANVMGAGFAFDLDIVRGAGAYICGEETAIFNSIEGYRGEPRNKPPFPVEVGLFGKPTVVNNVETLVNVLPILLGGGPAYAAIGTEGSAGTKLFCISGSVGRPGVYEVPFGATLRELLELAGGVTGNLRAVLLGGAAGGFVRPDELDLVLTIEAARAAGTTLGSGVVMVLDDTFEMGPFLRRIAGFFREESCGQCVPCRVGTVRQEEAIVRLTTGGSPDDVQLLRDVGQVMKDASICGLGQTAWNAIESAIDRLGVLQ
jgi:NADH-quinone oxidoreductase subunit F